jgi:ABC-type nitrate/sulfonate/bicarbonate transport system substrate-binding protein
MITRRDLLGGLAATGGVGLLGLDARPAAAEPPPETTRIRLSKVPSICVAPQYVAEEFLRSEGFTDVRYVGEKGAGVGGVPLAKAMGAGEVDVAMNFAAPLVVSLDAGEPIVILGGVHVGCFELFGSERVRTLSDLKGKTVAVPQLNSPQHTFIASIVTQVGLDPNRDITWREHPPAEAKRLLAEGKIDGFLGFPPDPQELRARKIGRVLVNSAVDRPPRHPQGRSALRRGAGPGRAGICRPGLQGRSRVRPPGDDGDPVRPLAGVQPGGDRALLRAPPAGSRDGEGQSTEADCRRHRLAVHQRAQERAEGVT